MCENHKEALTAFEQILQQAKFGDAGKKLLWKNF
ncbi:MAG: hypothetical protein WKF59_09940 [Chitinophagaceae bacterium]